MTCFALPPSDRVTDNWDGAGMVIRQLRRTHEGHLSTVLLGDFRNLLIISGHNDLIETAALQCRLDGPSDHRLTAEGFDVLSRNAFAAAAGRDDSEPHEPSALRTAATTSSCCSSVIVWNIGRLIASA